jgi:hypothetical protein
MPIAVFALACVQAVAAVDWQSATVLHAEYRADTPAGAMAQADTGVRGGGGGMPILRGQFEFEAGEYVYTAEERVPPNARLAIAAGDDVLVAVDKKKLRVRTAAGKSRSLNIVKVYRVDQVRKK